MLNLIILGYRIEPFVFYQTIIPVFSGLDDFLYKINAVRTIDINDVAPDVFFTPCANIVPLKLRTKIYFSPSTKDLWEFVNSAFCQPFYKRLLLWPPTL
jgi:hypothetical protein